MDLGRRRTTLVLIIIAVLLVVFSAFWVRLSLASIWLSPSLTDTLYIPFSSPSSRSDANQEGIKIEKKRKQHKRNQRKQKQQSSLQYSYYYYYDYYYQSDNHGEDPSRCNLCAQRWLIILATARSGSTTVAQMMNAIPDVYVAGEHNGILTTLMEFYDVVNNTSQLRFGHESDFSSWLHGPISEIRTLCIMQLLVKQLLGKPNVRRSSVLGFKEVRYTDAHILGFVARLFPCARFIVETRRDAQQQARSRITEFHKPNGNESETAAVIMRETKALESWGQHDRSHRWVMNLEDFSLVLFNNILKWLGVESCHFTKIARAFHAKNMENKAQIEGDCRMTGAWN